MKQNVWENNKRLMEAFCEESSADLAAFQGISQTFSFLSVWGGDMEMV